MTPATYSSNRSPVDGAVSLPSNPTGTASPAALLHRISEARSLVRETASETPSNALRAVIQNPLTTLSDNAELKWPKEPITDLQKAHATGALSKLATALTVYDPTRNSALIESFMATLPSQSGDDRNLAMRLASWHEVMTDVPTAALDEAMKKHLRDSKETFLPSPASIRSLAKFIENQWLYRARMLAEIAESDEGAPLHLLSRAGMSFSAMSLLFKGARFEKRDVWIVWMPSQFAIDQAQEHVGAILRKALGEYDLCVEGAEYVTREQRAVNLLLMARTLGGNA